MNAVNFTPDAAERIATTVRASEGRPTDATGRPTARTPRPTEHWARVTGATRDGSDWAWSYDTEQVYQSAPGRGPDKWTAVEGGIACSSTDANLPTARNTVEEINGASGVTGGGVNVDNLPGTYQLQPVPVGTPVLMRLTYADGTTVEYRFTTPNGVDGSCPT